MRILYILLLIATFLGCKQSQKEEDRNQEKKERWFFWSVDWHPTKKQFVVGGSNDSFLKFFSTDNFQELKSMPYKGTITKTKWHPTKSKLAISVQDGKSKSKIFNVDSDMMVELDSIPSTGARALGWNQSGNLLAVGDNEGFLTFFDENGKFLKKIDTGQKGLMSLDWHPKENIIVTVGDKISLYNYDINSLKHFEDRDEEMLMLCVAWNPNGEFFVTGDYGDFTNHYPPLLQYWTYEGEKIKTIEKSKAELRNLKWSNDGELLATASEKIRLWDKNGNLVAEEATKNLLWGIDWNKNGNKIIATDNQGKIIFWDRDLNRLNELKY
ncbi:WD40 repeat domain-containing protein [Winogradskyella sp.]|uniref:WD40 repeat domain-containing protein n=1 Tax=Winogradskyella sp. TaxID=1883156 RepID=UPI00261F0600|nr:WD40 repeat domain-containing protein [Winogradskyella sp.]